MTPDLPQPADDPAAPGAEVSDDGEWVSRAEACARLGIADRTLDNYIAAGKYRKEQRGRPKRSMIWVPRTTEDDRTEKALYLVTQFNAQLAAQVQPLVDKVESLARENGALAAENAALREQLRQAAEPATQPAAEIAAPVAEVPWWAFWHRWSRP